MKKEQYIFYGMLVLLTLFFILGFMRMKRDIPVIPSGKKLLGGCKGTRYGCCDDGKTACNSDCSNC